MSLDQSGSLAQSKAFGAVYSLGVCLLEIGVWKSFVHTEEAGSSPAKTQPSSWFQQHAKGRSFYRSAWDLCVQTLSRLA
ncbi:hypothetical protein LMH87_000916 [Akanthomyces muscarius]|uniref:Uncharacterized protein n=1 Tax=Akanthomyces muscarius TaxID=2231603 RepID=A0A9W8QFZ5_AKAMU|nr:hypothetical protein LMH87_000916 [Akanthomyces muscarius]KAJ4155680.1 hypothetical protein LMH87_000916 [Akanthomyces muscarius]